MWIDCSIFQIFKNSRPASSLYSSQDFRYHPLVEFLKIYPNSALQREHILHKKSYIKASARCNDTNSFFILISSIFSSFLLPYFFFVFYFYHQHVHKWKNHLNSFFVTAHWTLTAPEGIFLIQTFFHDKLFFMFVCAAGYVFHKT